MYTQSCAQEEITTRTEGCTLRVVGQKESYTFSSKRELMQFITRDLSYHKLDEASKSVVDNLLNGYCDIDFNKRGTIKVCYHEEKPKNILPKSLAAKLKNLFDNQTFVNFVVVVCFVLLTVYATADIITGR